MRKMRAPDDAFGMCEPFSALTIALVRVSFCLAYFLHHFFLPPVGINPLFRLRAFLLRIFAGLFLPDSLFSNA